MKIFTALRATFLLALAAAGAAQGAEPNGKAIYEATCVACHASGVLGAPKLGDAAAWAPRIKAGAVVPNAIKGKGAMPGRGGNLSLSDADVKAAVMYMLSFADGKSKPEPAAAAPAPAAAAAPAGPGVNTFNRLMRPASSRNLAQPVDGIHDADNEGTHSLQPPLAAFDTLVKGTNGNWVDWVKSLNENKINPRFDRNDPNAQPMVMDLNIVREVKGSMPDVVYPHKQHTQWLDCSNCHPAIFIPQKGANQISMAAILLGQKCGVCHGKVAFPVADCRRCHSKSKAPAPVKTDAKP
jgi:c(7)-type cytochrome triheme protein